MYNPQRRAGNYTQLPTSAQPAPTAFYQYHYAPPSAPPPNEELGRTSVLTEQSQLSFDIFQPPRPYSSRKYDSSTLKLKTRDSERSKLLKDQEQQQQKKKKPPTYLRFIYMVSLAEVILFGISIYKNGGFESLKVNPMIGPSAQVLLELGANYDYYILYDGEWWRFISAIFLHAGLIHLAFNLMFQIQQGVPLEKEFGSLRIAIIYMLSGITGNLMSSIFLPTVLSVGASGSLFGLLGAMLAGLIKNWKTVRSPCTSAFFLILAITINLVIGLLPFIDNFAHVGGLLAGIIFGFALLPSRKRSCCQSFVAIMSFLIGVGALASGFYIFWVFQSDVHDWCRWCRYIDCLPVLGWCDFYDDGKM